MVKKRNDYNNRSPISKMLSVQNTPPTISVISHTSSMANNPVAVYLASLSEGSRRTMKQALEVIAEIVGGGEYTAFDFPWHQLTYAHTIGIRTKLSERYSSATCNKMLAALKRVLKECRRLKLMDAQTYAEAIDIQPVKGNSLLKGRMLEAAEVKTLRCHLEEDTTVAGKRNLAMFWVLRVGLRRSEVVALDESDFNAMAGTIKIRAGKGNKTRMVYLPDAGVDAIAAWIRVKGNTLPALFNAISKTGRVLQRRMSDGAVLFLMREKAKVCGVTDFSPHDFRRTFISELLDGGADIVTAQQLAGHSSVETTSRYDRRGEASKRKAVNLLV